MTRAAFVTALALVSMDLTVAAGAQSRGEPELPNIRSLGRAAVEFQDAQVQAVAAYYHSQGEHDGPWLLIELGFNSRKALTLRRERIEIATPEGEIVPLSGQRRWGADAPRARRLLLQARTTRHPVTQCFTQIAARTPLRFFTRPEDGTTVVDVMSTGGDTIIGDLLFESPTGAWATGRYVLSIGHEIGVARLPIELR
jgi:hypothetical protein